MNTADILKKIAAGDESAFAKFYNEYKDPVYRTAFGYLRQAEEAEEITQDVFLEIMRSAKQFNYKSSVQTWVYRICINKSLDRLRYLKAKKRFSILNSVWSKGDDDIKYDIADPTHHGMDTDQKESFKLLLMAIEKLPPNQKTAIILTQLELLKGRETAEIMNTSEKSVEGLVRRGKASLKEILLKIYNQRGKYSQ